MRPRRKAPVIGITCEIIAKPGDVQHELTCDPRYAQSVRAAGGQPVLLPADSNADVNAQLDCIDGVILVGGDDVPPTLYGEKTGPRTHPIHPLQLDFDARLYRATKRRRMPVLGICYGMQLINVLEGGSLHQHLQPARSGKKIDHRGRRRALHPVRVSENTRLRDMIGASKIAAATDHHQAVNRIAPGFRAVGLADDGVIEAVECLRLPQVIAVQWHPERQLRDRYAQRLFRWFIQACAAYKARR